MSAVSTSGFTRGRCWLLGDVITHQKPMTMPDQNQWSHWWCGRIDCLIPGNLWQIHSFCAIFITDSWVFFCQNNILMMPQPPYSPDLVPCDSFSLSKPEENHERTKFYNHRWAQNRIADRAESHTENWVPEMLQRMKKAVAQVYYIWGALLECDNIDVWRMNII